MLFSLLPPLPAQAATVYNEVYGESMQKLNEWGVINGYSDGQLHPERYVTRAQFVAMINRAYGYTDVGTHPFTDVPADAWYADDIGIAYKSGYFTGTSDTTASPNTNLSRQQAMTLLAKNMRLETVPGQVTEFKDGNAFAPYASGYVKAAVQKGLVGGYPDGTFRPEEPITRGAMALLLHRALGTLVQGEGVHELGDVYGNVTIATPNSTLRNTTVAGDVYVSGGMGLGGVTLENVRALGSIVVAGSGESEVGKDSVVLRNVETDALKVDSVSGQYLSLRAEGDTDIHRTTVKTDAYIQDTTPNGQGLRNIDLEGGDKARYTLTGNLETVTNKGTGASLNVSAGTLQTLNMDEKGTGASVNVDGNGTVKNLNLDTATTVTGTGDVEGLVVNTTGSTTEMLPDKIDIRPGIEATVAKEKMNTVTGQEASEDPRLLAGYPKISKIAPTSATAVFAANKSGTIHWAVSGIADGSVNESELMSPSVYGGKAILSGTINVTQSSQEYTAALTKLTNDGSYYLAAIMEDARGTRSPVKVVSFSTPDGTAPNFSSGYPELTRNYYDTASSASNRFFGQYMVQANKTCTLYWAVYRENSTAPTPADFRAGTLGGSLSSGTVDLVRNTPGFLEINGLEELTTYDVYMWLTDTDFAQSSAVRKLTFTTVDGTPPTFISSMTVSAVRTNGLSLTCVVDEAATVYWVAVKSGVDYPKPMPGSTNVTPDYAIRQIKAGLNGEKSGSVKARANQETTINITGLAPQTAYDIWFIAQDNAGNFSVYPAGDPNNAEDPDNPKRTCMITANTLDNIAPAVSQEFTRTREREEDARPYADTDIRIVFTENVQRASTAESFLTLYQLIGRAASDAERRAARETLANALRPCITLYDATISGLPSIVTERTAGTQNNPNWVIDYRNAVVTLEDERMIVTFPTNDDATANSALHLSSGKSYYFEVRDIADTSAAANRMPATRLDLFRTVSAEVALANLSLSTSSYPMEIQNMENEADRKVGVLPFTMTPISTSMSDSNAVWDMLLLADTDCSFEMYSRIKSPGIDGTYLVDETTDALGWRKIQNPVNASGGVGRVTFTQRDTDDGITLRGQSLHFHMYNLGVGETPRLTDLRDNYIYEYAIRFTEVNNNRDRTGWSDTVNFRIGVVSGSSVDLNNLASNIVRSQFEAAKTAQTIEDIGVPDDLTFNLSMVFTDSAPPTFTGGRPTFTPADMSVEMRLQLTRRGTIYYAIAPADGTIETISQAERNGVPAGTNINAESEYWHLIPESGASTLRDGYGNAILDADGNTIPLAPFLVNIPSVTNITNPTFDSPLIRTGYVDFSAGTLPVTVTDLAPETEYLAYFVLRGTGQESLDSFVQIFRFTTTPVQRPVLTLDLSNPVVNISANRESVVDYMVINYTYSTMAPLLRTDFWGAVRDDSDLDVDTLLTQYPAYANVSNVITAMATSLASTDGDGRGSLFDKYAPQNLQDQVAELIRAASPNSSTTIGVDKGLTISPSRREQVDCSKFPMSERTQYAFLAVGQAPQGSGNAFRAIYPISLVDDQAPYVTNLDNNLRMDVDYEDYIDENGNPQTRRRILETFTGTVSLTFNEALYGMDDSTSPPELKQLDQAPLILPTGITRDFDSFKSIETMVQYSSSPAVNIATAGWNASTDEARASTVRNAVNRPTQVIALRYDHAYNGDFVTFASDLSDQYGNVHNTPLTVSVEVVMVRTADHIDTQTGEIVYELVPTPVVRVKPDEWDPSGRTRTDNQ